MGIERARVVEVYAPASAAGRVGSGYVIGDRLVLTAGRVAGRRGSTAIRPAGTATWIPSSPVWVAPSGDAAVLQLDDPSALMLPPGGMRWGRVTGTRPVGATAMGFVPSDVPVTSPRDATQFLGHVVPGDGGAPLTVTAATPVGAGMSGAALGAGMSVTALFAGAELVGVLLADADRLHAVTVAAMADDDAFVELFGDGDRLALAPVRTPATGFPILAV